MNPDRVTLPLMRRFGRTGLTFPEIGLGTWTFSGNDFGPIDDLGCIRVISKALELGVRFIDTADVYGRGRVEKILARSLSGGDTPAYDEVFLAGKVGNQPVGSTGSRKNFDPDYLEEALSASLQRLGRSFLHLLQLHNPPGGTLGNDSVAETLERWRRGGRIRYAGVSTVFSEDIDHITRTDFMDAVQIPFNLLRQELFLECESRLAQWRGAVIIRTPLEFGLLGENLADRERLSPEDYRRRAWTPEEEERKRAAVHELGRVLTLPGRRSLAQAAIQFVLLSPVVSVVIPGARTLSQLKENVAASRVAPPLSAENLRETHRILRDFGFEGISWAFRPAHFVTGLLPGGSGRESDSQGLGNHRSQDPLFESMRVGDLRLKNRIVRSATTERASLNDGSPAAWLADMYKDLAHGGVAMIVTGYVAGDPGTRASPSQCVLNRSTAGRWKEVVESVKAEESGVKLCVQLAHGGRLSLSPSRNADGRGKIVDHFARAVETAWGVGFDMVQLHAAHGYLLSQLLGDAPLPRVDPDSNPGLRLLRDLLKAVRGYSRGDGPILIKVNMTDFSPGRLGTEDAVAVVNTLSELGLDAIEWSGWIPEMPACYSPSRPGDLHESGEGFFVPFVSRLKAEHPSQCMGTCGGFRTKRAMTRALTEYGLDFVALSRPLIAEPDLPQRFLQGQEKALCDGCNACTPREVRPLHCPIHKASHRN